MKLNSLKVFQSVSNNHSSDGFTLIELLVAMAISIVVIGVAGLGLVTIMGANRKAEAESLRRKDLNRALDFIADEIRMASRVNSTTNVTTTASSAITAANAALSFNPSLGSIGTTVLYLEIPIPPDSSVTCALPATVDRVVYDIRSNTSTWLGPRVINRYGRIPRNDGTINPCSNPVASEALVDAVESTDINAPCVSPAVRSGAEGFYTCVDGRQVDLYLRGKLTDAYGNSTNTLNVKTKLFVRSAP